jgi:hypothetical protein
LALARVDDGIGPEGLAEKCISSTRKAADRHFTNLYEANPARSGAFHRR